MAGKSEAAAPKAPIDILFCSFCGKSKDAVKTLIAGPTVFICNECVAVCTKFISGEASPEQTDWDKCSDEFLLEQLPRTSAIADAAGDHLASHVATLRKREVTWEAIGRALGVSRQAAWERFS
ncbi:MAG: ATP-dependent Clp protease ATP-binding subunit ClpX [Afipia sp.]|nr:MAG: ATP-dependent Clp protease ATP-binding subunit ClpX [Afipia sp.]